MTEPDEQIPPEWPPEWWDLDAGGPVRGDGRLQPPDLNQLIALLEALRRAVPAELQEQVNNLVRETLLTVRALIDWYLERSEAPRTEPPVEDIPIE